jgi:phospholipid/cholesterol/gamma-HCH transport system substrate-binding protein
MITEIRKRAGDFAAIIFLVVVAAVVGTYILKNQRLRFPVIEDKPMRIFAELSTAQAVTPGQGQTVRVAGVKVGDIATVRLKDGRALVGMDILPVFKEANLIRQDATALLRSKTGLKDMFIEVSPGTRAAPPAREGFTIPVANTLPDVNPDEVLSALDADTRDYLKLLINGAGEGLRRRGSDLQEVLARLEPTNRDLARLNGALSERRANLRRLIHSLQLLNTELARSGQDVSELVDESAVVFRAFAAEQANVRASLRELPPSLRQVSMTLDKTERFANVLRPTADRLRPTVRAIPAANAATRRLALEATPTVRDQIRPFVREARPLATELVEPVRDLADATPHLTETFEMLNKLFNLIGYNDNGREGPGDSNRDEGFLFWIAWVTHQTEHLFTLQDANGSYRPLFTGAPCSVWQSILEETVHEAEVTGDTAGVFVALFGINLQEILFNVCGINAFAEFGPPFFPTSFTNSPFGFFPGGFPPP